MNFVKWNNQCFDFTLDFFLLLTYATEVSSSLVKSCLLFIFALFKVLGSSSVCFFFSLFLPLLFATLFPLPFDLCADWGGFTSAYWFFDSDFFLDVFLVFALLLTLSDLFWFSSDVISMLVICWTFSDI